MCFSLHPECLLTIVCNTLLSWHLAVSPFYPALLNYGEKFNNPISGKNCDEVCVMSQVLRKDHILDGHICLSACEHSLFPLFPTLSFEMEDYNQRRRRDGLATKSTCCSCTGPRFDSQQLHDCLQPPIILVSGDPKLSSVFHGHQTCM